MKIGVIGLGLRMANMLKTMRQADPGLKIAGLVDLDPKTALARLDPSERTGIRVCNSIADLVALSKPDAIAIGTRCDSHARLAAQAAKYPLPLFLEKPVATTMRDAVALERAFLKSRTPVLVSFPLRASALCRRARQLIERDTIGPVEHLLGINYVPYGQVYFEKWYRDYSVTQGLFLQKATHDFDYLAFLAGAPIVRVAAMYNRGRVYRDTITRRRKPAPGAEYWEKIGIPREGMNEDSSSALLEFANGAQGVYTQVFYTKRLARRGATVSGGLGTVSFDWYANELTTVRHREPVTKKISLKGKDAHFGGDLALAKNFVAMVRSGAPSLAPLQFGLESVYACLAAKQSAATGKFVNVRPLA